MQGTVKLKVTFESDGEIGEIEWISDDSEKDQRLEKYGLVGEAIAAARKISFETEIVDGKHVTVTREQSYIFTIY